MRSASNAAGGGKGALPPEKRMPGMGQRMQQPPPQQRQQQQGGGGGGNSAAIEQRLGQLETRIASMEEKLLAKIRNLYVTTETLTEKLAMLSQKVEDGTNAILSSIDRGRGVAAVNNTIVPHVPGQPSLVE